MTAGLGALGALSRVQLEDALLYLRGLDRAAFDGAVAYATQRGVTPAYIEPPGITHCADPGICTCGGRVDADGVFHPATYDAQQPQAVA